jgi:hypothetical protein
MTYGCKARVIAREAWEAYKMNVLCRLIGFHSSTILTTFTDLILALAAIAAGRSKVTARAIENRRVRALVKEALETLQAKEAAHYIDPVRPLRLPSPLCSCATS